MSGANISCFFITIDTRGPIFFLGGGGGGGGGGGEGTKIFTGSSYLANYFICCRWCVGGSLKYPKIHAIVPTLASVPTYIQCTVDA